MKKPFINLQINRGRYRDFIVTIIQLAKKRQTSYVCVANVHMLVEAYNDQAFAHILNCADVVTPDGMPLAIGIKRLYGIHQDRVAGMDLLPDLLEVAQEEGLRVFFYGGTREMQCATENYVKGRYPRLKAAGFYSPPFRDLTLNEEKEIIEMINRSGANIVMVALGCPKQEKWMASMRGNINACMIGIGGALPVMIGMQTRAPRWMRNGSLEWLYRLYQEPGRLWKRYLYTNSLFLMLFTREWIKIKILRQQL
jgi:N-acetylglucosaminyldiphosphoundecaprenol N-acetyl-beta-D-mannosaminyltransferase